MPSKKRDYKKEYRDYHGTPEQIKRRAERNKDRRAAEKRGAVHKGDGKEVDHIHAPRKGSLKGVRTRVTTMKDNRSRQPKRK